MTALRESINGVFISFQLPIYVKTTGNYAIKFRYVDDAREFCDPKITLPELLPYLFRRGKGIL